MLEQVKCCPQVDVRNRIEQREKSRLTLLFIFKTWNGEREKEKSQRDKTGERQVASISPVTPCFLCMSLFLSYLSCKTRPSSKGASLDCKTTHSIAENHVSKNLRLATSAGKPALMSSEQANLLKASTKDEYMFRGNNGCGISRKYSFKQPATACTSTSSARFWAELMSGWQKSSKTWKWNVNQESWAQREICEQACMVGFICVTLRQEQMTYHL